MDNFEIWQTNYKRADDYNYQSGGTRWQLYLIKEILKRGNRKIHEEFWLYNGENILCRLPILFASGKRCVKFMF